MGVPRDFSASPLFISLNVCNFITLIAHKAEVSLQLFQTIFGHLKINSLVCALFHSMHFNKSSLKEEWEKLY